jgi:hypothetical protein
MPPRHQSPGIPDRCVRPAADGKDQRHPGPSTGALDAAFDQHQLNRPAPTPESLPPVALRHQAEDVARLPLRYFNPANIFVFGRPPSPRFQRTPIARALPDRKIDKVDFS